MIELYQDDFVVKAPGSTKLKELDEYLANYGQESWLAGPEALTVDEILRENYAQKDAKPNGRNVLGLKVKHKNGLVTETGGQVLKNVSGYDLKQIYIGSKDTLVEIQEVYLRTRKLLDGLSDQGSAVSETETILQEILSEEEVWQMNKTEEEIFSKLQEVYS